MSLFGEIIHQPSILMLTMLLLRHQLERSLCVCLLLMMNG
ncbi:hypothetical protein CsSME_00020627 [Camellia sinensis var. sinensis]